MRLDRVDLNLFVVFDTIYTERNLTRAAELLCLSQPAVSNALARLRKTLNDDLFVRTPKGMVPTPMADNIIVRIREALNLMTETLNDNEQFDPRQSNKTFRLSMTDFSQSLLLPALMAQLQQQAPDMSIESYYLSREEQARAMAAGQLDLAIDYPMQQNTSLLHSPLLCAPYVCVMGEDHPALEQELTMENYLGLQHLHISSRNKGLGLVDVALHRLGHARNISLRVASYLLAPYVVNHSPLAATIPASMARQLELPHRSLPFEVQPLELHLYWHKNAARDPASMWLRNLLGRLAVLN